MQFLADPRADAPATFRDAFPWASLSDAAERLLRRPVTVSQAHKRVFIIGCPRSGTTVVQAALAERGNLLTLPETHFFSRLFGSLDDWMSDDLDGCRRRWHSRLLYARANTHHRLKDALAGPLQGRPLSRHLSGRGYVAEFVQRLDDAASAQQRAGWLEKTPEHFAYVEMIRALCPDALFVHVMRAGEDVVASAVDAEMRFAGGDSFRGGAAFWVRHWNRAAETHLRYAGQPRHHVVCHEDLVQDSEATLTRLLEWAGLDDEPPRSTRPGEIADLRQEPWKRDALSGRVVAAARKFEALFGPQAQRWVRERLHDYGTLRAEVARRQGAGGTAGGR